VVRPEKGSAAGQAESTTEAHGNGSDGHVLSGPMPPVVDTGLAPGKADVQYRPPTAPRPSAAAIATPRSRPRVPCCRPPPLQAAERAVEGPRGSIPTARGGYGTAGRGFLLPTRRLAEPTAPDERSSVRCQCPQVVEGRHFGEAKTLPDDEPRPSTPSPYGTCLSSLFCAGVNRLAAQRPTVSRSKDGQARRRPRREAPVPGGTNDPRQSTAREVGMSAARRCARPHSKDKGP